MPGHAEQMRVLLTAWEWDLPRSDMRWMSVRCGNHDDRNASARVHMDEGAYTCLACGLKAGTMTRLVMAVQHCDWRAAADYLRTLSIDPTQGENVEQTTGPKRPWKAHRKGRGGTATWRRSRGG